MTKKFDKLLENIFLTKKYLLKNFFFIIILCLLISFSFLVQIAEASSDLKISVLYFNDHTQQSEWNWLSKGLTDILINDLSQVDAITCSSRQDIEDLYYKYNLLPLLTELEKPLLIQINEDLKVEIIFFGNYYFSSPSNLKVSLKKYEVATGEITTFRDFVVEKTDLWGLEDQIVFFILKELNIGLSDQDKAIIGEIPTTSLEALSNYYKCLDSRDKAIVTYQGADFPSKKLWAEAIEYGERAVVIDPKYADGYYLLAEIYNRTHWTIKEAESLNKFIQLVEANQMENKGIYEKAAQAYFRLGYAFYSKKDHQQAIEYFNSALKYNPDLLEAHLYLVQIYYDMGEIGLSLDECEEVLRIDPQNKEIPWFIKKNEQAKKYGRETYENYEKGYLAYKKRNFEEAIPYFKLAILKNPNFKEPHYYLALSYYEAGDLDNSISQWEKVIEIDSFDNTAKHFLNNCLEEKQYGRETLKYFNTGYDYYLKGEYDKAIKEFNQSLDYNPEFEKARQFLSRSYYQLNQMDKYLEEREKVTTLKISGEEEKAEEHYKLGYEFYSLKNYTVAMEELKEALNLKSDYPNARYLLAECYFQKGEYKIAQVEYERVVTDSVINEYTDDALLGSGWCYYLLEEYPEATEKFLKLLKDFPDSNLALQARYKLGKSYFKAENYPEVIKIDEEFIEKYPEEQGKEIGEVYYLLGQAYFRSDQYKEAEEVFKKMLSLFPEFELVNEVKYFEGLSLFKQDKFEEAIAQLEDIISTSGIEEAKKGEAQYLLARCYLNLKEYNKSIENLENLKQLKLGDSLLAKASFDLGLAYSLQGDKEKAVLEFQEFIERYPQNELIESAYFELGKNLYDLKEYKLALSEFKKVSTAEAIYWRGKASEELGDQEGEISAFEELKKNYPQSEFSQEAYFKLGNSYYNQSKYKEAIEEFEKIIQSFPHSSLVTESYYWMGWSYFKLTNYQKANEYFNQVEEKEGNLTIAQRAKFMAAESWYNLKDYQKAQEAYRQFIEKYPNAELSVNAQYAIAWSYLENKEYEASVEEFKKLIIIYPNSKFIEEARFRIGKNYFLLMKKEMAKTELEKFINSYTKSDFKAEALYLISQISLQEEKWIDSIINLERLVREYPDSQYLSEAWYGLCLSYFKKDEYEKAIQAGENYLQDYSNLKYGEDILYIKAVCWEKLENREKAINDYQLLISKFPQSSYLEKAQERLKVLQKE
ncbi:hypothetical protein AUK42_05125 [Candidatus Atribacteria bacterium CG2_30_33_13]|uniref:Outer membrane lipoprotein BamD-like domain-containing protein n=1 Tax=Candidatus Infernicultor aquiphilus TaxID=1805029 RepID=A0A1J5G9W1_9BACT|nr:MAG: hypothetical protein AUK42_05125 [Candidatus Atribacteria bacterium CG2_30_33_13]